MHIQIIIEEGKKRELTVKVFELTRPRWLWRKLHIMVGSRISAG